MTTLTATQLTIDEASVQEEFFDRGWTDGLPIVAPTPERVEAMLEHAMKMAREIASKNPLAVTGAKAMINYARDHTIADGLDYIGVWNAAMLSGAHMKEAFMAKAEKREPDYPDLMKLGDRPL